MESNCSQSYMMWLRPSRLNSFGEETQPRSNTLLTLSAKLRTTPHQPPTAQPVPQPAACRYRRSLPQLHLSPA
jgi:hypothetical protein